MVLLGVFEGSNDPDWGALYFALTKPKTNQVRYNLNNQLKGKPYTMSKINEILFKLEVFQNFVSLDLNMEYYHIRLTKGASNLCTIVLPGVKYC